ncbi:hypothetical protein [Branchiibius sp. NY16-3462-2]|uniref:hypothetical protein n=1 Tax=Branchiibius sp. NY16-3462-2 TaxID=1807500 RepID=UPI000792582E|nr:hypothetical protein [Branchiibius sp. NY16-3462-2]KYH45428.1 hypothetical protein AZH51_01885 [Branchiibius sp. NY16-3462-2]
MTFTEPTPLAERDFRAALQTVKPYTMVVFKPGPNREAAGAMDVIARHGNRNLGLQRLGYLPIILPVRSNPAMSGVGVFTTDLETTKEILEKDPAIEAGVLVYEIYPTVSFPGSSLP